MYFDNNIISDFFNSGFEEDCTINSATVKCIVVTESDLINYLGIQTSVGSIGIMLKTKYNVGTTVSVRSKSYVVEYVVNEHGIYTHMLKGI